MSNQLDLINSEIVDCQRCDRLAPYIRKVAVDKVRRHAGFEYWGRPVPGFGDPNPKVLCVGLAPAAHGANRTGRMFTGDSSGDWLFKALYESGFANQPNSDYQGDGLELRDMYIGSVIHCAPPQNKPLASEIEHCGRFLEKELKAFKELKVILTLGGISFNLICKKLGTGKLMFGHHKKHELSNGVTLISSYHPSRQNTNTGRLKPATSVFHLNLISKCFLGLLFKAYSKTGKLGCLKY